MYIFCIVGCWSTIATVIMMLDTCDWRGLQKHQEIGKSRKWAEDSEVRNTCDQIDSHNAIKKYGKISQKESFANNLVNKHGGTLVDHLSSQEILYLPTLVTYLLTHTEISSSPLIKIRIRMLEAFRCSHPKVKSLQLNTSAAGEGCRMLSWLQPTPVAFSPAGSCQMCYRNLCHHR